LFWAGWEWGRDEGRDEEKGGGMRGEGGGEDDSRGVHWAGCLGWRIR